MGGGFIDSGSGLGVNNSLILDAPYIRIIILVTLEILVDKEYLYSSVGFFYVDVDRNGNVSLKT